MFSKHRFDKCTANTVLEMNSTSQTRVLTVGEYKDIITYSEEVMKVNDEYTSLELIIEKFPNIPEGTLGSILRKLLRKLSKKNIRYVKARLNNILKTCNTYFEQKRTGVFLDLAKIYSVPAITIVRLILDTFFVSAYNCSVSDMLRDTSLIQDPKVAYEVHLASIHDISYGHISSIVSSLTGREYEDYLQNCLKNHGLTFKTEADLRNLKYPKTPDVLLDVPIAVDNHIVKWIESKAQFADDSTHLSYVESQYQHYTSLGPGLVIYWFGYLETIRNEKNSFIVYDRFPEKIYKMSPYKFNQQVQ